MKKRANKALFGSMMFLAVFLVVFLSTTIYTLVQSLSKNTRVPSSSNTNTNTNSSYITRIVEQPGIRQTTTNKPGIISKLRAISRMAGSFNRYGAEYSKRFDEIEAGEGIIEEIQDAFKEFEDAIVYNEPQLDFKDSFKPMKFGFSYKTTRTAGGGFIHTLDLTDALGIPGSVGLLQFHTPSEDKIFTDESFTVEDFCAKENLIVDYEEDLVLEDGTECHRIYLKEENGLPVTPYVSMINPNESSPPIQKESKFACFTAIHPESSQIPAVLISERISIKTETATNPNFAFHIKNAMGVTGSEGLFIGSRAMLLHRDNELLPDSQDAQAYSRYFGKHFDSIQTYGELLRKNKLKYADCDSFKEESYDYTVHYACRDHETFRQLKGKIEDFVEAIYQGAWAYPGEQVAFRDSVITNILNQDDVAILIVIHDKKDELPDFDKVLNNYTLVSKSPVYQIKSFFSSATYSIGLAKVFKIIHNGQPAYYLKFLRGVASFEQTKKAPLNFIVSQTGFEIINALSPELIEIEVEISNRVREICLAEEEHILESWTGYLKFLTGKFPALDSLEVIFVK